MGSCLLHFTSSILYWKQQHTRHPAFFWTVHFEQTSSYIPYPATQEMDVLQETMN